MNQLRTRKKTKNFSSSPRRKFAQGGQDRRRNNRRKPAGIDPYTLIKKTSSIAQPAFVPSITFAQMPLNSRLKRNLNGQGYLQPTQIQEETFNHLIAGRNLIGIANTGTGKTSAFLLPIIEQLLENERPFQTLIVVPTRELALQVKKEFKILSEGLNLYASSFIGGTNIGADLHQLKRKTHVIIGTPGRLLDLTNRGALKVKTMTTLVLDEFDRMLDMGFVQDIKKLVDAMQNRQQTMLFSATIDRTQKSLIAELMQDPIEVKASSGVSASDNIEQDIIKVPRGEDKFSMLLNLMEDKEEYQKVLVFAETRRMVDKVKHLLSTSGVRSDMIHGDKSQGYRNKALSKFKNGRVQVLVATDVAARGIDISDISHVINYQVPLSYDSYVHRIGRTGRAGKKGKAITFVD